MASREWSSESWVWLRRHGQELVVLLLCCIGILWIYDPKNSPALFLALLLGWAATLARILWRLRGTSPPLVAVLIVAGLLRILLVPLPLSLSDDAYRYVWDGKITRSGFNPYALSPDDPALVPLRDELWAEVAHRDVETVYPPLAIAMFSLISLFSSPIFALKSILALVDLGCCWLLLRYAAARGAPTVRVLAYAFNPLVVFETAGMGHVDALGIPLIVLAAMVLDAASRREAGEVGLATTGRLAAASTGGLVAMGVLVKLVPVLLVPAFARRSGRQAIFVAVVGVLVLAAFAPFLADLARDPRAGWLPPGLITYGVSWEFNGPVFEPLWRLIDVVRLPEAAKWLLQHVPGVHAYLYPQLLAKALLGLALIAVVVWSLRARDLARAALRAFGGWVLLSATVYPWYLLWMLPWAALLGRGPWLLLSVTALFGYLPTLFGIALLPWPYLLVWGPPLAALVWQRRSGTG